MIKFLMIPIVVCSAAGAQILMKYTIGQVMTEKAELISIFKLSYIYASVGLYVIAFAATIYLFSVFELSFISPVLVGGVMLLIFIAGMIWGEAVSPIRITGGVLLVAGTFLLSYSQ